MFPVRRFPFIARINADAPAPDAIANDSARYGTYGDGDIVQERNTMRKICRATGIESVKATRSSRETIFHRGRARQFPQNLRHRYRIPLIEASRELEV